MFAKLTIFFAIVGYAYGQTCLGIAGPSISGICPTGSVDKSGVCCVTDPKENCNDQQQWCPSHQDACEDKDAGDQMKLVCPYTCASCDSVNSTTVSPTVSSTVNPSVTCVDKVNPSTGVSDCPSRQYLCNNALYKTLMQQQCPKTCGFCAGAATTCVDKVNPSTGVSDCPTRQYLCTDANYKTLMQQQCPKTCGYC